MNTEICKYVEPVKEGKIIMNYIKSGRYLIRVETGFKTCLRPEKATRFHDHQEAYRWLRSQGIASEVVNTTTLPVA